MSNKIPTNGPRVGNRMLDLATVKRMGTIPLSLVDGILATRPDIHDFVETGTYLGETVDAVMSRFERLWTVELSDQLFHAAKAKYREEAKVMVFHGDSRRTLPDILQQVGERPALFWLDGHWSGGSTAMPERGTQTAIRGEIEAIAAHCRKDHVILVDDAIDFRGESGYPTVLELIELLQHISPRHRIRFHRLRRGVVECAP